MVAILKGSAVIPDIDWMSRWVVAVVVAVLTAMSVSSLTYRSSGKGLQPQVSSFSSCLRPGRNRAADSLSMPETDGCESLSVNDMDHRRRPQCEHTGKELVTHTRKIDE